MTRFNDSDEDYRNRTILGHAEAQERLCEEVNAAAAHCVRTLQKQIDEEKVETCNHHWQEWGYTERQCPKCGEKRPKRREDIRLPSPEFDHLTPTDRNNAITVAQAGRKISVCKCGGSACPGWEGLRPPHLN